MELQPLTNSSDEFNFSFPNTNLTAASEATAHTTRIPVPTTNAPIFTAIPATRKFVKLRPRKFVIAQNPELACRNLEAEIAQTVAAHMATKVQVKENKDVERFVLSHLPPGSIRRAMQAGVTSEQIRRSVMSSVAVLCGTTEEEGSQEGLSGEKEDGIESEDFEKEEMSDNAEKRNEVNFQQKGAHEEQERENIKHRTEINERDQESGKPHEEKKKEGSGNKDEVEKEGNKSGEYNEDDDDDEALYREIYDELVKQDEEETHAITETDPPHTEIYDKLVEQEKGQGDDQALYAEIYEEMTKKEDQDESQDKDEALHTETYEDMVNQEEVYTITGDHPPHIEMYDKLVDQDEFEDQALYTEMYEEMIRQEEQKKDQDEDKAPCAEIYEDPVKQGEVYTITGTYPHHTEICEAMVRKDEGQLEYDDQALYVEIYDETAKKEDQDEDQIDDRALYAEIYDETTKQEDQDEDQADDQALYAEIYDELTKQEEQNEYHNEDKGLHTEAYEDTPKQEPYAITGTHPLHSEIYSKLVEQQEDQDDNQALYAEIYDETTKKDDQDDGQALYAEIYDETTKQEDQDEDQIDDQALYAEIYDEVTKQEEQDEDQDDDQALYAEIYEDIVKKEAEAYTGTDPLHAEIYEVTVGEAEGQVEGEAGEVGKETNIQGKGEHKEVPEGGTQEELKDGSQTQSYLMDFEDFSQQDCDWVIALLDASPEIIEDAASISATATNVSLPPTLDADGDTDSTNLGPKNELGGHDNKDVAHDIIDTEANDIFFEAKEFLEDLANVEADEAFSEVRASRTPSTLPETIIRQITDNARVEGDGIVEIRCNPIAPETNHRTSAYWLFLLAVFSFATGLVRALVRGIARSLAVLGRCAIGILLLGMRAIDLIQRLATILAEVVALAHFAKVVEGPLREAADGTDYEIIVLVVEKFNRGVDTGIDWAKERYGLRGAEKTVVEERQGIQEAEKTTIAAGTCGRDSWFLASPLPVPVVGQAVPEEVVRGVAGGAAKSPDGLGLFLLGFLVLGRGGRGWRRRRLGRA